MNTEDRIIKIGIVGAGIRGIACFGELVSKRDDAKLVALTDPNKLRAEGAVKILKQDINYYPTIEEMLQNEELDGVIITSPDYTHEANCLAAIASGVHVLVDKPLATTAEGCMNVIRAARERNVEVAVGFNLRHVPILSKVKELIDSGEIGQIMLIENREFYDGGRTYMSRWNRKYEWSGGLWVHKGSHDFDIFNWWNSGGIPTRVSAFGGVNALREDKIPFDIEPGKPVGPNCATCAYFEKCPDGFTQGDFSEMFNEETAKSDGYLRDLCMYISDKDTHDNGIAIVEYDNNVRASHLECFISNFSDRLYTIVGDRGTIIASLENPTRIEIRPRWGGEDKIIHVPKAGEGSHGGADPMLLNNFITSIKTGDRNSSTSRDGIRSVAVGDAAERSWRHHRMIDISEIIDLYDPIFSS